MSDGPSSKSHTYAPRSDINTTFMFQHQQISNIKYNNISVYHLG